MANLFHYLYAVTVFFFGFFAAVTKHLFHFPTVIFFHPFYASAPSWFHRELQCIWECIFIFLCSCQYSANICFRVIGKAVKQRFICCYYCQHSDNLTQIYKFRNENIF